MKDYNLYDDRSQALRYIDRYPKSFTRTPAEPLIERPLTLSERTGPVNLFNCGPLNMSEVNGKRATGQLIEVKGRILDEDGSPIRGAAIELWQANAAGKYIHAMDNHQAPVDPNFIGQGRLVTNEEGEYEFFSIKPGAYPVLESGWWWRPPHIHFSIFGVSWMDRYVTQIFFPGEPLNETDLLLNGVADRATRDRLLFDFTDTKMGDLSYIGYRRDFVLRGHKRTPEVD
ncbi:MAG: protocatechuate 3,4-dioxygenase subunit beta [Bryobacteraceae bacterium]